MTTKKNIAFLFYPNDWLGGTLGFTREHKGAYMDLIIFQYNNGPMTIDDIKDVLGPDFDKMWERKLKIKFTFDKGKYFNKKIEDVKEKQNNYSESRKNNLHGHKNKTQESNPVTIITQPTGTVAQYFQDLPNSKRFEEVYNQLSLDPEYLKTFIDPFKIKAELEYPTFLRFVTHFKNYVAQELKTLKNEQSNPKSKQRGTYNADGLSQLNNAIKGREDQS
jgi:hypothetical protein